MRHKYILFSMFLFICTATGASSAYAQEKPFQISLITPIQLVNESTPIKGVRLNIFYGRSVSVTGVDWGLINHTTTGHTKGWQAGLAGLAQSDFTGYQDNFVNITKGKFTGFQSGLYNHAAEMHGFQLGFINYAESGRGLQIGLINLIKQGGVLPVMPIVNWTF